MIQPPPIPEGKIRNSQKRREENQYWLICLILVAALLALFLAWYLMSQRGGLGRNSTNGSGTADAGQQHSDHDGTFDRHGDSGNAAKGLDDLPNSAALDEPNDADAGTEGQQDAPAAAHESTDDSGQGIVSNETEEESDDQGIAFEFSPATAASTDGVPVGGFSQAGAKFFGIEGKGDKIAFIVDCSSSMAQNHSNINLLERCKLELLKSVNNLDAQQKATVIFYNQGAISDPRFVNSKVTKSFKEHLKTWVDSIYPSGGTNPQPALEFVLKGEYDLIYLLSDGEFDFQTVQWVAQNNKKKIMIHCISMVQDSRTLRDIAQQSKGKYIFVK
jgi:hypothetical protein